jgi:THO complex subunit 1
MVIFGYMESRVHLLTIDLVPSSGKALVLLRLCNELLRRVNKAKHAGFSGISSTFNIEGRILCLLSTCFPLSERSAVNQKGEFNNNVTAYQEMAVDDMDVDGQEEDKGML